MQLRGARLAGRAGALPAGRRLEDPTFAGSLGPGSFGSDTVDFAYRVDAAQKVPFPGKLKLRGQAALAEARAAGGDVEDTRLRLIESTRAAFYDYYLVGRALEVNAENLRLLSEFRRNAETRYRTGLVPQQDVLQADVEVGRRVVVDIGNGEDPLIARDIQVGVFDVGTK